MSNRPFDRTIIYELEKPLADDINQSETNFDQSLRFFLAALFSNPETGTPLDGFLSTGLLVAPAFPADMSVSVTKGLGFQLQSNTEVAINSVPGLNDLVDYKPLPLNANQGFTVPVAPVAPNTRVDIIEVRADRITTDPSLRQVFNTGLGQFVPGTLAKTLAWALDGRATQISAPSVSTEPLSYVIGQEGNPGLAPPTSPGYIKLADIAVGSDVTAISASSVTDLRGGSLTTSAINLNVSPANGHDLVGVSTPVSSGLVDMPAAAIWGINAPTLQQGDVIENIVLFLETNLTVGGLPLQCSFQRTEVDPVLLTYAEIAGPIATVPAPVPAVLKFDMLAGSPPGTFPFTWAEHSSGDIFVISNSQTLKILNVTFSVRRVNLRNDF